MTQKAASHATATYGRLIAPPMVVAARGINLYWMFCCRGDHRKPLRQSTAKRVYAGTTTDSGLRRPKEKKDPKAESHWCLDTKFCLDWQPKIAACSLHARLKIRRPANSASVLKQKVIRNPYIPYHFFARLNRESFCSVNQR